MEKFDYTEAVAELESLAQKVEDPSTGLSEVEKYIKRSAELIAGCREYLRSEREKVDSIDKI